MIRRASPLLLTFALAGCAGAQHPWTGAEYCRLEAAGAPATRDERLVALLLRGYDPATRRVTAPALTCANTQVRWDAPALACEDTTLARTLLPDRPLEPDDVVVSPLGPGLELVWIVTNRYASGDALGPVAVVEDRGGRLVVRALGNLRAYPRKAALRLEAVGAQTVLVADGESCAGGDASCVRSVRMMPLRGDAFAPDPIYDAAGACETPAWIDVRRVETQTLPSGWRRRYALQATLAFQPAALEVGEQVLVEDVDPRQPQSPPRLYRKAEGERTIRAEGSRLTSSAPPLLRKVGQAR